MSLRRVDYLGIDGPYNAPAGVYCTNCLAESYRRRAYSLELKAQEYDSKMQEWGYGARASRDEINLLKDEANRLERM